MKFPAYFVGHGSPQTAVGPNPFFPAWEAFARSVGKPRAILCVSAHWETSGVRVTGSAHPSTIHDFSGFSPALHAKAYPAPGSPELAAEVLDLLGEGAVDPSRGLDHGAWAPLCRMWPAADVPVVQLSLDRNRTAAEHVALAARLAPLRDRGVLVLGSGNAVHNLGQLRWGGGPDHPWAARFEAWVRDRAAAGDLAALAAATGHGASADARLAVPTPEHFLPLLYVLALRAPGEPLAASAASLDLGSLAMTCWRVG